MISIGNIAHQYREINLNNIQTDHSLALVDIILTSKGNSLVNLGVDLINNNINVHKRSFEIALASQML